MYTCVCAWLTIILTLIVCWQVFVNPFNYGCLNNWIILLGLVNGRSVHADGRSLVTFLHYLSHTTIHDTTSFFLLYEIKQIQ